MDTEQQVIANEERADFVRRLYQGQIQVFSMAFHSRYPNVKNNFWYASQETVDALSDLHREHFGPFKHIPDSGFDSIYGCPIRIHPNMAFGHVRFIDGVSGARRVCAFNIRFSPRKRGETR